MKNNAKLNVFVIALISTIIVLGFQNCARTNFNAGEVLNTNSEIAASRDLQSTVANVNQRFDSYRELRQQCIFSQDPVTPTSFNRDIKKSVQELFPQLANKYIVSITRRNNEILFVDKNGVIFRYRNQNDSRQILDTTSYLGTSDIWTEMHSQIDQATVPKADSFMVVRTKTYLTYGGIAYVYDSANQSFQSGTIANILGVSLSSINAMTVLNDSTQVFVGQNTFITKNGSNITQTNFDVNWPFSKVNAIVTFKDQILVVASCQDHRRRPVAQWEKADTVLASISTNFSENFGINKDYYFPNLETSIADLQVLESSYPERLHPGYVLAKTVLNSNSSIRVNLSEQYISGIDRATSSFSSFWTNLANSFSSNPTYFNRKRLLDSFSVIPFSENIHYAGVDVASIYQGGFENFWVRDGFYFSIEFKRADGSVHRGLVNQVKATTNSPADRAFSEFSIHSKQRKLFVLMGTFQGSNTPVVSDDLLNVDENLFIENFKYTIEGGAYMTDGRGTCAVTREHVAYINNVDLYLRISKHQIEYNLKIIRLIFGRSQTLQQV
jgi:hypothetical protein